MRLKAADSTIFDLLLSRCESDDAKELVRSLLANAREKYLWVREFVLHFGRDSYSVFFQTAQEVLLDICASLVSLCERMGWYWLDIFDPCDETPRVGCDDPSCECGEEHPFDRNSVSVGDSVRYLPNVVLSGRLTTLY